MDTPETPASTYFGTQTAFLRTVIDAAKEHGAKHNHPGDAVVADLCANLLSGAIARDPTGALIDGIIAKAVAQAEVLIAADRARFNQEAAVALKVSGLSKPGNA